MKFGELVENHDLGAAFPEFGGPALFSSTVGKVAMSEDPCIADAISIGVSLMRKASSNPASAQKLVFGLLLLTSAILASEESPAFDAEAYRFHPFGWQATADGFVCKATGNSTAERIDAPLSRRVTVEAELVVDEAIGNEEWKIATVAIVRDPENFWHFGLVLPPPSAGRPNFCELSEMRDGFWNAQGSLKSLKHQTSSLPWKVGERYQLRITLSPEMIEGVLRDASGEILEHHQFSLANAETAVASGRPALHANGLSCRFAKIRTTWDSNAVEAVAQRSFPPYQSNSFVPGLTGKATGVFRVEKRGGKWWAFDPLGRGYVPLGVDHVRYTGHWCEALGHAPYHLKMQELYPNRDDWIRETADRLIGWGFNRLGAQAWPPMIHQGLSYSRFVGIGTPMAWLGDEYDITPNEGRPCTAFPNVFHPEFEAYCRYQAEITCRPCVGDPWLFGYFLDNELAWWGRGDHETGLFDAVMKKSAGHTAKVALRDFLAERHQNDVGNLNEAWGCDLASFDEILRRGKLEGSRTETVRAGKAAFLALVADRYFSCTTGAIHAIDPDHLILGCRFAGGRATEDVWAAAVKYCDVLSLNYYGNVDLDRELALDDNHSCQGKPLEVEFAEIAQMARGKPLLVTEWSFIALDSGLPCTNGAGQRFRTQAERAKAAGIFAETLLRIPEVIGFDYFMWADEPALGISSAFPENSNYGLVDGENRIYKTLAGELSAVLKDAGRLHREGPKPDPQNAGMARTVPTVAGMLTRLSDDGVDSGVSEHEKSLTFQRDGDAFEIRNGRLTLLGMIGRGPVLRAIQLDDGATLGHYVSTTHQSNGSAQWPQSSRVVDVRETREAGRLIVQLTSQFEEASPDSSRRSFEIVERIHLLPGTDRFLLEFVSYRNLSKRPVELRGIYFQIFPARKGAQPASANRVPRLWGRRPGDAWIEESSGAFVGVFAPPYAPVKAHFWVSEHGGYHPDAQWPIERRLGSGELLTPDRPVYWIVAAGRGGRESWERCHDGAK